MTFTVASLNDLVAVTDEAWAFGADEAVASDAFNFTFDDEGCLASYWVTVDVKTGAKEKIFTAKGAAALEAYEANTEFDVTTSTGTNATGLLATDYAISDYTTWK